MSANRHRGEVEADLGGRQRRLRLTLGTLAELETAFGVEDLAALARRFSEGRLSALDMARIIAAGLRGAGEDIGEADVLAMDTPGGAAGFARIVAELLSAAFGTGEPPANP